MASTAALDKRLTELEALMKEVMRSCERTTRAYAENREPIERRFRTLEACVHAEINGVIERVNKLEGR
jgi:septation ring formation regulator EzrA